MIFKHFDEPPPLPPEVLSMIETMARVAVVDGVKPGKAKVTELFNFIKTGTRASCFQVNMDLADSVVASRILAGQAADVLRGRIAELRSSGAYRLGRA